MPDPKSSDPGSAGRWPFPLLSKWLILCSIRSTAAASESGRVTLFCAIIAPLYGDSQQFGYVLGQLGPVVQLYGQLVHPRMIDLVLPLGPG